MNIIYKIGILVLLFSSISPSLIAGKYKVSPGDSQFKWTAKKVVGQHNGTINLKQGNLVVEKDKIVSGNIEIDMNSIVDKDLENESWNNRLVGHLKSDDFFSVEKFPSSSLVLKKIEPTGGTSFLFTGDLTIKGITHPVTFDAFVDADNSKITATGTLKVDRTLYDIKYRSGKFFSDLGNNMIDDIFTLDFNIVASKTEEK